MSSAAMPRKKKDYDEATENVRVYIRVRPLNKKEKSLNVRSVVHLDCEENVITLMKPGAAFEKVEKFVILFVL